MPSHTIKKTLLGKQEVVYPCPGCQEELRSPLEEAGQQDQCPHCEAAFRVPGADELTAAREEQVRSEALQEAERNRRRIEEEAQRQAEESRAARVRAERQRRIADDRERKATQTPAPAAPGYGALIVLAGVLRVLGVLQGVAPIILVMMSGDSSARVGPSGWTWLFILGGLTVGAVVYGIGEGVSAFRDLCINSWHSRHGIAALVSPPAERPMKNPARRDGKAG